MRMLVGTLLLCVASISAYAQTSLGVVEQERAEALYNELRCVVCQNQSIGESDADVAKDLRAIVSEQIAAGKTDAEVKGFLVDRYGEFILLKPVFAWHTLILWVAPALLLLFGIGFAWSKRGQTTARTADALSDDEERRIAEIIDKNR